MSDSEYVVDVIQALAAEGEEKSERDISPEFCLSNMLITDTQAFCVSDGNNSDFGLVTEERGAVQQLADWKTNLKIRLKEFTILADQEAVPPKGRVHRGFCDAWQSVEKMVVYYLKKVVERRHQTLDYGPQPGGSPGGYGDYFFRSPGL